MCTTLTFRNALCPLCFSNGIFKFINSGRYDDNCNLKKHNVWRESTYFNSSGGEETRNLGTKNLLFKYFLQYLICREFFQGHFLPTRTSKQRNQFFSSILKNERFLEFIILFIYIGILKKNWIFFFRDSYGTRITFLFFLHPGFL